MVHLLLFTLVPNFEIFLNSSSSNFPPDFEVWLVMSLKVALVVTDLASKLAATESASEKMVMKGADEVTKFLVANCIHHLIVFFFPREIKRL